MREGMKHSLLALGSAAALSACATSPAPITYAETPSRGQRIAESGEMTGRMIARGRGFCPLDVIGTEQNGAIFEDPEIPILRARGYTERDVRLYVMGRGYGCGGERERMRQELTNTRTSDTIEGDE